MPVLPPGGRLALDGPDGRIGVLRGACGSVRVVAALFSFARRTWGPCGLSRSLFSLRAARLGPLWALAAASFSSCGAPGALVGPGHRFCFLRAARLGPLWALAAAFFHPCGAPGALVGPGRRFCFLRAARLGPFWAPAAASVSFARRAWGPCGPWLPLVFISRGTPGALVDPGCRICLYPRGAPGEVLGPGRPWPPLLFPSRGASGALTGPSGRCLFARRVRRRVICGEIRRHCGRAPITND